MKQTATGSDPNSAAVVLKQTLDVAGRCVWPHSVGLEVRGDNRVGFFGQGIETAEAVFRCDPINALTRLADIVDCRNGQPVFLSIASEAIAIESAQTINRAEPQEPAGVAHHAPDSLVRQTIHRCVNPDC